MNNTRRHNIANGIKDWLNKKDADPEDYEDILELFCKSRKDFDPGKIKSFRTLEAYVSKNFAEFCSWYGIQKLKKTF